jgi:hypothetical protein
MNELTTTQELIHEIGKRCKAQNKSVVLMVEGNNGDDQNDSIGLIRGNPKKIVELIVNGIDSHPELSNEQKGFLFKALSELCGTAAKDFPNN